MDVIGFDPGHTGAWCWLNRSDADGDVWVRGAGLYPLTQFGRRKMIDTNTLYARIGLTRVHWVAFVEEVHAMPGQGVSSTFAFGRGTGAIEALAMFLAPGGMRLVAPQKWKRHHRLIKADKKQAVLTAAHVLGTYQWDHACNKAAKQKLKPSRTPDGLTQEERIAVADAALIAAYGLDRLSD